MTAQSSTQASDTPLVTLTNVSWRAAGADILDNVSLSLHAKEIVTLIGPNGAGKSSLVKIIAGLIQPATGSVTKAKHLSIGYMPQRLDVNDTLPITVHRFLSLGCKQSSQLEAQCELMGLTHLLSTALTHLSGGEMQRVLLARCVLRSPQLLILDEPTQGVDINGQTELYQLISRIRDDLGCGVLMVSHDLHLVMAQTDTVICLNKHVCCHGEPDNVSKHPEYLQMFGASAARSIAVYTHDHDHDHDLHGDVVDHSHCDHKH